MQYVKEFDTDTEHNYLFIGFLSLFENFIPRNLKTCWERFRPKHKNFQVRFSLDGKIKRPWRIV